MIDGNDSAFPFGVEEGLTKREIFAAMAMQGLLSNGGFIVDVDFDLQVTANISLRQADALIEELNK